MSAMRVSKLQSAGFYKFHVFQRWGDKHMCEVTIMADSLTDFLNQRFLLSGVITAESDLIAAGVAESLTIMDLLAQIEQEHGVCFQPEEIVPANFQSVNRLAELVVAKQQHLAYV
jgi:acyl carrier protein